LQLVNQKTPAEAAQTAYSSGWTAPQALGSSSADQLFGHPGYVSDHVALTNARWNTSLNARNAQMPRRDEQSTLHMLRFEQRPMTSFHDSGNLLAIPEVARMIPVKHINVRKHHYRHRGTSAARMTKAPSFGI